MKVWVLWLGPGFSAEGPACEDVDDVIAEIVAYEEDQPPEYRTTVEGRRAFRDLLAVLRPGDSASYGSDGIVWTVECMEIDEEDFSDSPEWSGW